MDAVCTETLETKHLENSFVQSRGPQFLKRGEVRRPPPLNRPALTIPEARQRGEKKQHLENQNILANFNYPAPLFIHQRNEQPGPLLVQKARGAAGRHPAEIPASHLPN